LYRPSSHLFSKLGLEKPLTGFCKPQAAAVVFHAAAQ